MVMSPQNAMLGGIALGLLLGGVANGMYPPQHTLSLPNPLWFLNWISYTWYAVEGLYIAWLTPADTSTAPGAVAFMAQLGVCNMHQQLTVGALAGSSQTPGSNISSMIDLEEFWWPGGGDNASTWWNMTSTQRLTAAGNAAYQQGVATNNPEVQAAAQMFIFYSQPERVEQICVPHRYKDILVLLALGVVCRMLTGLTMVVRSRLRNQS
jgi:hypothetical protein